MHLALQPWKWAGISIAGIRGYLGEGEKEARELDGERPVVEFDLHQYTTVCTGQQKWSHSCSLWGGSQGELKQGRHMEYDTPYQMLRR